MKILTTLLIISVVLAIAYKIYLFIEIKKSIENANESTTGATAIEPQIKPVTTIEDIRR